MVSSLSRLAATLTQFLQPIIQGIFAAFLVFQGLFAPQPQTVPGINIVWSEKTNVSSSPELTSTDPFLLSDPAGYAHLFWAEKGELGLSNTPDTIMYSLWNGSTWSKPADIQFSPPEHGNQIAIYPQAVIDANSIIHLVWLAQPNDPNYSVFYSKVPAALAGAAGYWSAPVALAEDLSGTNYSVDIEIDADGSLHVAFSRVPSGFNPPELRATSYVRSTDGGASWSDPVDLYTVPQQDSGTSNVRLLVGKSDDIYASWTVWNSTGNGQVVMLARSLNSGVTWEPAIPLSRRVEGEYERDWNSLALLDEGQVITIWEGGYRAYRQAQYSNDFGATWTQPADIFPDLIGENGFVEFARDSNNTLHAFWANRAREGSLLDPDMEGLWHTVWLGGQQWARPVYSSDYINMLNPKMVIVNGNLVVATWYTFADLEIMTMTGVIQDAPPLENTPWPAGLSVPTVSAPTTTPSPDGAADPLQTATPTQSLLNLPGAVESNPTGDQSLIIVASLVPTGLLLAILIYTSLRKSQR